MAVERTVGIQEDENEAFTSAVFAALVAGVVFGVLLHETGRMESIAGLYGQNGVRVGWALHFGHSIFAGIFFLGAVNLLITSNPPGLATLERTLGFPTVTAIVGIVYGVVLWGLLVATLLPLSGVVVGFERPLPYLHRPSLVGLAIFGGILGMVYAIVFRRLTR